jgi:roadblock/LC7 domain-containing protein
MRAWIRGVYVIAGIAVALVAVSSIVQAVRQGSWTPIVSVAWLPAVVVAARPGTYRRCLPGRRRPVA